VLLGVFAFAAGTVCALKLPGPWAIGVPLSLLLAFGLANPLLNRLRLRPSSIKLRAPTQLISGLVAAPIIVFGHSHAPERLTLRNGATYFNTGTWASDDPRHAFTHLVVTHAASEAGEPFAELRQWRDGASAPYVY
jgi:hypothetical protein